MQDKTSCIQAQQQPKISVIFLLYWLSGSICLRNLFSNFLTCLDCLIHCVTYYMKLLIYRSLRTLMLNIQWQGKSQWAQTEIQEIPFKHKKKKKKLLWGWWNTGTGCPEWLWSLPPWRYSKPEFQVTCSRWLLWAGSWTRHSAEMLSNLNYSMTVLLSDSVK